MGALQLVPRIRIYISSPADLARERGLAENVVARMQGELLNCALHVYAYDPDKNTYPLLADRTPQASVNAASRRRRSARSSSG
jgi:hypothetical protein